MILGRPLRGRYMKRMKKFWKKTAVVLACLSIIFGSASEALAAEKGDIVASEIEEKSLVLYLFHPGDIEGIQCQVGTEPCTEIHYEDISVLEVPVRTILLVDNSISIAKKYRSMISEILNNLVANRMDGELFTVATFSDSITYLIEDSNDYTQLKSAIDGITYQDQETYLTDVLYEMLKSWQDIDSVDLKRIIIISDGVDNKAIGYTKEELYSLLEENSYPIYTLGCKSNSSGNNEALENMFALSRMTYGESWLMDDIGNAIDVAERLAEENQIWKVTVNLPESVCDGTQKGIKLTITDSEGESSASITKEMPFTIRETETESVAETVPETKVLETTQEETTAEALEEKSDSRSLMDAIIGGGAVLVLIALAAGLYHLLRNKKEAERFRGPSEEPVWENNLKEGYSGDTGVTEIAVGGGTEVIWKDGGSSHTLVLTDQDNLARTFQVPMSGVVVIGREQSCQVVINYAKTVSRRHCQIRLENGQLKLMDLGSRNGTMVNNKKIIGETDIYSGSVIGLGSLKLKVELRG